MSFMEHIASTTDCVTHRSARSISAMAFHGGRSRETFPAPATRAFARQASLAEGLPISVASLIADDTAQVWQTLCARGAKKMAPKRSEAGRHQSEGATVSGL
jgi:hypothetical protein